MSKMNLKYLALTLNAHDGISEHFHSKNLYKNMYFLEKFKVAHLIYPVVQKR